MGGVRHHHLSTVVVITVLMVGLNYHNSSHFAVSSRCWLQGNSVHTGNFRQQVLHIIEQFHCPLHGFYRLVRVNIGKSRQAGCPFIYLGTVFHGTGTQGIKPIIYSISSMGKVDKMPYRLYFTYIRQGRCGFP